MDKPLTIWHVGGEDVHLRIPLLLRLRERGFEVGAVGSGSDEAFQQAQIPFYAYELHRFVNPLADRRSQKQLTQLFAVGRPDVIHAFDTKPALLAPLAAEEAGVPGRVRTITGMGYVFSSNSPLALTLRPIYRQMQRSASRATGITVFQNRDDREYFRRQRMVEPGRDALVLGSGVDVAEFLAQRPTPEHSQLIRRSLRSRKGPVVTMIARLVRHKGVIEYIEAAKQLHRQGISANFILAGPLTSEGRQAVAQSVLDNARGVVRYLGVCGDVPALLSATDIFVLPSYYREGVPRVLLEAGAMGLPLVTTRMPGCKEVVRSGHNGILVPPRDAGALAAAIGRLISIDPAKRTKMGEASQRRVRGRFELANVTEAYAAIYERSLQVFSSDTTPELLGVADR